jgi:Domain of unknown function (DU1801)
VREFQNPAVAQAFEAYPSGIRSKLLAFRELIFDTAKSTKGVGEIEETLRWGEPAYLTTCSGSGSTVRIGWKKEKPSHYAMYFNCQTNLVETFKTLFPGEFRFEGNRAIIFAVAEPVPTESLSFCVAAALTYHQRKTDRAARSTRALERR